MGIIADLRIRRFPWLESGGGTTLPCESRGSGREQVGGGPWPSWAKLLASIAILMHGTAVVISALAAPPSSGFERGLARRFRHYYGLVDMGYSYRFFSPDPAPLPIVTARLRFNDGSEKVVRLPNRRTSRRWLQLRLIALAITLAKDLDSERFGQPGSGCSRWARSYARHLQKREKGQDCVQVDLYLRRPPAPRSGRADLLRAESSELILNADEEGASTVPVWIGSFRCDGS
jgi:hypothetical protein